MKYLLTLFIIALLAVAAGCSSEGESQQASGDATNQGTKQHSAVEAAREAVAKTEARQLEEGAEITVAGTLGCGHCTYHVGESCSAAIQTTDGAVFILDIAEESEWFQNRYDGTTLEVTGKVQHRGSDVLLKTMSITEL